MVKNPSADAEDVRKEGSIPWLGRSPEGGHGNHPSILVWRIPWMEKPGRLWGLMGSQRVRYNFNNLHRPVTDILGQREKENYSVKDNNVKTPNQTKPTNQTQWEAV